MPSRDLRDFFSTREMLLAIRELENDAQFQKRLDRSKTTLGRMWHTTYPLKYLGIELSQGGKPRFPLATVMRIAIQPRSMDGASKGLRLSKHRRMFIERFPKVDAALSLQAIFDSASAANLTTPKSFSKSAYASLCRSGLEELEKDIALPVATSLEVLRKGLAAYKGGHRPGMSAHGWARARLTSFVMKGCTHFFPDHLLSQAAPAATKKFWRSITCICSKQHQCGRYGIRTRANAPHRAEK